VPLALSGHLDAEFIQLASDLGFLRAQSFQLALRICAAGLELLDLRAQALHFAFESREAIGGFLPALLGAVALPIERLLFLPGFAEFALEHFELPTEARNGDRAVLLFLTAFVEAAPCAVAILLICRSRPRGEPCTSLRAVFDLGFERG
jgi:hypothetical protein